jgi:hypothetical protein
VTLARCGGQAFVFGAEVDEVTQQHYSVSGLGVNEVTAAAVLPGWHDLPGLAAGSSRHEPAWKQ